MKNRKKRIKCIVTCIFLVLVYCLSACGREKEEVQPKEKEQTEIQESKEEIENEIKKEAEK